MNINIENIRQSIECHKKITDMESSELYNLVLKDIMGSCIFSAFLTQEEQCSLSEFDTIFRQVIFDIKKREYAAKLAAINLIGLSEVEKGNHNNTDIYQYGRSEADRIRSLINSLSNEERDEIKPAIELYCQTIGSSFNFGTAISDNAQEENDAAFMIIDKMFVKKFGMHICENRHRLDMSEEEWVMTAK
ncbi:hypothetical protein [Aeromonas veronii]|uniref:hypothetical protein n=1 Tax=Aeromonas veronii TaxID=654 RepID=UPI0015E762D5|nr:hypothetical protein [Aeromonas veronii]MBA2080983.1 hypothetical protein [Aeromonas veronii]